MKKNLVGQELVGVEVKVVKNQITGCLRHYFEIGEIVKCIRIFKATKTGLFVNKHGIIQQLFLTDIELITSSCEEEKNATKKTIEDLKKEIAKKTAQINVLKDKIKSATNHLENLKIKKIKSTITKTKITFKELLERAKDKNIVVHTPTEEQSITLLKELDKKGYTWCGGVKLTTTHYKTYKENTCYDFSVDTDGNLVFKKVMYSPLSFYQEECYTIIEFEDIDFAETKITFTELLEKAKTERIAIHTPTERQAKALLKALDKKGYRWIEGEKLTTETQYEVEEENTCYNFELNKKIMYSPLSFYQDEGYTIIKFEDIEWKGDWYVLL